MYVILNEECTHVLTDLSPRHTGYWKLIEDLVKEKEVFQLTVFKNPGPTLKVLADHGVIGIHHRLIKFMDEVG